jgi:hypothetical protein
MCVFGRSPKINHEHAKVSIVKNAGETSEEGPGPLSLAPSAAAARRDDPRSSFTCGLHVTNQTNYIHYRTYHLQPDRPFPTALDF